MVIFRSILREEHYKTKNVWCFSILQQLMKKQRNGEYKRDKGREKVLKTRDKYGKNNEENRYWFE